MGDANSYKYNEIYSFGTFVLDVDSGVLTHENEVVHLPPKAFQLLVCLVRSDGRVVTKDELFTELWPETFVEDGSLSYAVFRLRKALSKIDDSQKYVETIARRGFRFLAPVERHMSDLIPDRPDQRVRTVLEEVWIDERDPEPGRSTPIRNQERMLPDLKLSWHRNPALIVLGLLLSVLIGTGAWFYSASKTGSKFANIRKIAVLPIGSFEASSDDEALRLKITDSLITRLGSTGVVPVSPTTSIVRMASNDLDPVEAGKQLKVDAVLAGRMQREAGRLRITFQLISVETGEHLWSEQFDGQHDRLLDLQDVIATALLNELRPVFADLQTAGFRKRPTSNNEAYDNYLHGRFRFLKRNPEDIQLSMAYFERAIEIDPNFVDAKIGLAKAMAFNPVFRERIVSLLNEIDKVDPNISEAHCIRGFVLSFHDWDWRAGAKSFETAIRLDPNNSLAHQWYGNNLMVRSRFAEAEVQLQKALELDPTSVPILTDLGQLYLAQERFEEADSQFSMAITMQTDRASAHSFLHMSEIAKRRSERLANGIRELSIEERQVLEQLNGVSFAIRDDLSSDHESDPDYIQVAATISAFEQDRETTLAKLRQLAAMRKFYLPFQLLEPVFEFLRDDPEYIEILDSMNLRS